jgi:DNA-binding MarR family transcriptional regulator
MSADRAEALEHLGRSFKGAMAAVRRLRGRETHRPGDLSFAQYSLLFGLGEGGELSVRELALTADLAPATVTQMLDGLEATGLVERARSQRDRRIVLISLTERGAELVAARRARFEPLWRGALAEFDEDELLTAAAVLDRLRELFYDVADDQSVSARPKAANRSEPNVVISAIAPSSTRSTSSLNAR